MSPGVKAFLGGVALLVAGCNRPAPDGSLVLTQTPAGASAPAATELDARYPLGSRVVLLVPPFAPGTVRELSRGLVAAGDPCVSWDGRWVYFAGKSSEQAEWQIYKVNAGGGRPERMTRMPGGAMDPALAAHETLVFSSPVPKAGETWTTDTPAAIFGQLPGQPPRRLSYGPDSAVGSTVLGDGRILFVTARPHDGRDAPHQLCLFTINNDGTEVTAYAGQDDGMDFVRRPRELGDGRTAFLKAQAGKPDSAVAAEYVRSAAPFVTRARLLSFQTGTCRSVEAMSANEVLACLDSHGLVGRSMKANTAVYRLGTGAAALGVPLYVDPAWNCIEAAPVAPRPEPAGHTTAVMPAATRGTVLCLNVNDSGVPAATEKKAVAAELRVFRRGADGQPLDLGKVPVASDGSVLVYLPANVPLGFETLDATGRVLRRQPAFVWLQPGENRGCVGCHEPRSHSPRNVRPVAAMVDPAHLESAKAPTVSHPIAP